MYFFVYRSWAIYSWGACKRTFTVDVLRRQSASFARGGGVLRYISHIGICRPTNSMVFAPFWSENFAHFGLELGMVSRELRECMEVFIVSIPNE